MLHDSLVSHSGTSLYRSRLASVGESIIAVPPCTEYTQGGPKLARFVRLNFIKMVIFILPQYKVAAHRTIYRLQKMQILTDFQNCFTVRIRRQFAIGLILSLKIPPHLKCVAPLHCEL